MKVQFAIDESRALNTNAPPFELGALLFMKVQLTMFALLQAANSADIAPPPALPNAVLFMKTQFAMYA